MWLTKTNLMIPNQNYQTFDWKELKDQCIPRLAEILDNLEIEYKEDYKSFYGPCPIHQGDKYGAFVVYKNTGLYRCFTHSCHEEYGQDIFAIVKAIKNLQNNGQAAKWLISSLKLNPKDKDEHYADKSSFAGLINHTQEKRVYPKISRFIIRQGLKIPSEYYLNRGYSSTILDDFDVGTCYNPRKFFFERAVIPVYDDNWQYAQGFVGRSIHEQCIECNAYHHKNIACPDEFCYYKHSKWTNSPGFQKAFVLFNYWRAKTGIRNSEEAILVEGPGDSIKLQESNISNSVAIMGSDLSDQQLTILEQSGAFKLITLFDSDEAGDKAREIVTKKCARLFNLEHKIPTKKDVGDMNISEIMEILNK